VRHDIPPRARKRAKLRQIQQHPLKKISTLI